MATVAQKTARRGGDLLDARTRAAIAVTATANTDIIFTIPKGAVGGRYTVFTTTAFGAATDATIQIGTTAGGSDIVAAATIKALGVYDLTRVAAGAALHLNVPQTLYIRIVQTGTASATGAATLVASYGLPVS